MPRVLVRTGRSRRLLFHERAAHPKRGSRHNHYTIARRQAFPGSALVPPSRGADHREAAEVSERIKNIRDCLPEFAAYYARNPSWGVFHVVLDDGNTEDRWVTGTEWRLETEEERRLHGLLKAMSRTQRDKLRRLVHEQGKAAEVTK